MNFEKCLGDNSLMQSFPKLAQKKTNECIYEKSQCQSTKCINPRQKFP